MPIPIANLYYLLAYASDVLPMRGYTDAGAEPNAQIQDLFARILLDETANLVRRGLDQGYVEASYDSDVIRGRIDFADSIRRAIVARRVLALDVAELTHDVLHNQILRASLLLLAGSELLDRELKGQLMTTSRNLRGVSRIDLTADMFARVQLGANARTYRFLMDICHIIYESLLPDEQTGSHRFRDFLREDGSLAKLWEKFLLNFYRHHAKGCRVQAKNLSWGASSAGASSMLPQMRTDVWIEDSDRVIVIDAKYYVEALQRDRWDSGRLKLQPSHVNQMFSYLSNAKRLSGSGKTIAGALLYPRAEHTVRAEEQLHEFRLTARTIDLTAHWSEIECELLAVLSRTSLVASGRTSLIVSS